MCILRWSFEPLLCTDVKNVYHKNKKKRQKRFYEKITNVTNVKTLNKNVICEIIQTD